MCAFHRKMADRTYTNVHVWLSTKGVLDLRNGVVSEKTPLIFGPPLPTEYVTEFSGQTDAPEVRSDLTDRQTDTTTPVHAR